MAHDPDCPWLRFGDCTCFPEEQRPARMELVPLQDALKAAMRDAGCECCCCTGACKGDGDVG